MEINSSITHCSSRRRRCYARRVFTH